MIIFDNTVLSTFTRLKLFPSLEKLLKSAIISKEMLKEFHQAKNSGIKFFETFNDGERVNA